MNRDRFDGKVERYRSRMTSASAVTSTHTQPVVVGTIAYYLGKKSDEYHSHKWTVYVRGANGEDLSHCVAAVEFTLHPSFEESTRRLTKAPFEVTETGWGNSISG